MKYRLMLTLNAKSNDEIYIHVQISSNYLEIYNDKTHQKTN